jgi:leucyl-tRNA synthetase
LIESLSDSTIYFAFYTVAHLLQGDIQGTTPGILGIKSEDLTLDFWSHIFLGHEYKSGKIPDYKL